jgi:hypothetical protein
MLAEGHHAGIEVCLSTIPQEEAELQARVVRIENGDVEGRGNSFRGSLCDPPGGSDIQGEHKIKHGVRTMDGKEIATSTCFLEIEEDHVSCHALPLSAQLIIRSSQSSYI